MDHSQKYKHQLQIRLTLGFVGCNIVGIGAVWVGMYYGLELMPAIGLALAISIAVAVFISGLYAHAFAQTIRLIQQAVLHVAPHQANPAPAPQLDKVRLGRELVTSVITNMYQMANVVDNVEQIAQAKQAELHKNFIATNLPLPMIVLNDEQNIVFANQAAIKYLRFTDERDVIGQSLYTVMNMSFLNAFTYDAWLQAARKSKPTAVQTWERVKLSLSDSSHTTQLFDLAAYYNKDNPYKYETILVLFDHTDQYSQDDQAMSLVALGVHELRTPLTLMRGYVEAFEEDLGPMLNAEQAGFMRKMIAASQQLGSFVNNILNIARVEEGGMSLRLTEQQWEPILKGAAQDMSLRAQVRGIRIEVGLEPNLPTVGVDKMSVYEVLVNLIDNAIKYSGKSDRIVIKSYLNKDGDVETTVQDFGVGVPSEAMPNLFDKFYRNHRNRATVGGTGLGLFLSKAIVSAHSGHIWVQSKADKGSTFGFSVLPYTKLAAEAKTSDNKGIERGAHGWIKNHSLYRR